MAVISAISLYAALYCTIEQFRLYSISYSISEDYSINCSTFQKIVMIAQFTNQTFNFYKVTAA